MNKIKQPILLILLSGLISGCISMPDDVSHLEPYKDAIGYRFESKVDLIAHGINMDQNYKGGTHLISLMEPPGIGGPEVKFRKEVPKGLKFKVTKVWSHRTNLYFTEQIEYVIEPENRNISKQYPITVDLTDEINSKNKGLPEESFRFLGQE